MKLLLSGYENMVVVDEASNGKEFIDRIEINKDCIILLDIDMPVMNGIEATRQVIGKYPETKIIALSMYGEEEYYYKMIDAGVKGFLLKNSDITEVIDAIETVANNGNYFARELLYNVVRNIKKITAAVRSNLSERETEVLYHICKGMSNQEIATLLNISKRTVDKHRASLLSKTDSKNTANLVMYAIKEKLVEL